MTDHQPSLGEFLKSERERRGFSLEQVSSVTKIGVRVLQSLEQDRYSELPALPFVKGFIKTYCQLLQLDPKKVLEDYDGFLREKSKSRPSREGGMSGYAFERPEGEQAKKVLWAVMGGMLVFGGLVVFIFKPSLKHRKHGSVEKLAIVSPTPSISPSPTGTLAVGSPSPSPTISGTAAVTAAVTPSPTPSPTPSVAAKPSPSPKPSPSVAFKAPATPMVLAPPTPTPPKPSPVAVAPTPAPSPIGTLTIAASPTPSPSPTGKPDPLQSGVDYAPNEVKYKILIKALADVWVRYQCDDKKVMRFALKGGRILVLRGKNLIRFQASNPDSITFNPNGQGYRTMASSDKTFEYLESPTLVWPSQAREKIGETFQVSGALPFTAAPSPTQGVGTPEQTQ